MTFITQEHCRAGLSSGHGRNVWRCRCWMRWLPALSAATDRAAPAGLRLHFERRHSGQWNPAAVGKAFEFTPILKPLEPVRDHINVLSGLAHLQADTFGDGTGDHPRASAVWLTGVHAWDRTRPGVEVQTGDHGGPDRGAARSARTRRWPSLEMNVDNPTQGACDSGDCFYVNTVSWRNETTPNPAESHPRVVFERLFGDGGSAAQRLALAKSTGSILDSVTQEVNRLAGHAGRGRPHQARRVYGFRSRNRAAHSEHRRRAAHRPSSCRSAPSIFPDSFEAHTKLMFDLQVLAFRADITRVFSMIMARELSSRTYPVHRRAGAAPRRLASPQRSGADRQEGQDRHVSRPAVRRTSWRSCRPRRTATARCWTTA